METKEYYTPTIEDLYFGYQFEYKTHEGEWIKHTFNGADMQLIQNCFTEGNNKDTVRTAFLCKQDIIDFGFKEVPHKHPFLGNIEGYEKHLKTEEFNELSLYRIVKHPKSEIIEIHRIYESSCGSQHEQLFSGLCKSKNEFIKLIKDYLNIHI